MPKNVAQLKYLGTTVTNEKLVHDEIKSLLYQVVFATIHFRGFVFPSAVENVKIKIC
jgi:hypothetical protein